MIRIVSGGLRSRGTHVTNHHQLTGTQRRRLRIPIICSYSGPDLTTHYAVLGLTPFASKTDVKQAYKRLALKYHPDVYKGEDVPAKDKAFVEIKSAYEVHNHPDVYKGEDVPAKDKAFMEIKSAYECLMQKFDEDELQTAKDFDENDDWEEWMGFEGGIPVIYNPF